MPGQGEELAFTVGFDEEREMRIEKIYRPRGGRMNAEKIIEAYVVASNDAEELRKDAAATELFDGYGTQVLQDIKGIPHKIDKPGTRWTQNCSVVVRSQLQCWRLGKSQGKS
ncbi:hypothetical protein B0H17DRAFT_1146882 [Mycena rosella]|uniref:Uncharacterized protein n=1 Tax=Mycena rosella TaxID=1033263 RepID=A0AAD7CQE0_MYCRO|nr:hypothetical protein B0H17DRAFT_1146882 [Mycena rosella]